MDKKATKTVTQAMQERNEQRATEMMTKAAKMIRNAQDLISTLERLVSEDRGNAQPCTAKELVKVDMPSPDVTSVPELHVVKDGYRSDNKTGYIGVFFENRSKSYAASVRIHGRARMKSGFKTPEEAKVVREQMKRELLKEIEGELNANIPVYEGKEIRYDQKTLNALGKNAWIAWAKEAMMRLAMQRDGENMLPDMIQKTENQTRSRVKSRLNWARIHACFAGKTMDEANALNEYDVLANDHALRDVFTEIVLLKLSGVHEDVLVERAVAIKKPAKRKGVRLKEENKVSKAG